MYENYDIERDKQGYFRALRPGTKIVIYRTKKKSELVSSMQSLQIAYENGKVSGERNERVRIKVLLGL